MRTSLGRQTALAGRALPSCASSRSVPGPAAGRPLRRKRCGRCHDMAGRATRSEGNRHAVRPGAASLPACSLAQDDGCGKMGGWPCHDDHEDWAQGAWSRSRVDAGWMGLPAFGRRRCRRGRGGGDRGGRAPLPTGGLSRCAVMDGRLLLVLLQGIGDRKPLRLRADPNVCHRSSPRVGVQGAETDTDQREGSQTSVYGRSTAWAEGSETARRRFKLRDVLSASRYAELLLSYRGVGNEGWARCAAAHRAVAVNYRPQPVGDLETDASAQAPTSKHSFTPFSLPPNYLFATAVPSRHAGGPTRPRHAPLPWRTCSDRRRADRDVGDHRSTEPGQPQERALASSRWDDGRALRLSDVGRFRARRCPAERLRFDLASQRAPSSDRCWNARGRRARSRSCRSWRLRRGLRCMPDESAALRPPEMPRSWRPCSPRGSRASADSSRPAPRLTPMQIGPQL